MTLSKKKKHWLMALGFAALALYEVSVTSMAAAALNTLWLMEE